MSEKEKSTHDSSKPKSGRELLKNLPYSTDRIGEISVTYFTRTPKGMKDFFDRKKKKKKT